jgi:MFS family permease
MDSFLWDSLLNRLARCSSVTGLVVGFFVFTIYFTGSFWLPPGWDEGYTWKRLDALEPWLAAWFSPQVSWSQQMSKEMLERHWQFSREEPDGHGPFYALLSLAGHTLTASFLPPPVSYRIGSIALFALAVGCLFQALKQRWTSSGALLACALLVFQPRLIPEVCFGVVDGPLVSLAILAYCGFLMGWERPTFFGAAMFGIPAGLAMATKLTGWVLIAPYLLFVLLDRRWLTIRFLIFGGIWALVACYVVNVSWWFDPITGLERFFKSNLTRADTRPIPNWFLGKHYEFSLPWYNTIIWTIVAMPPMTLALGVVGLVGGIRERPVRLAGLIVLTILAVRSLPQAPGHDGVRQIIVAFAMISILAGACIGRFPVFHRKKFLGMVMLAFSIGWPALEVIRYFPLCLSYYSPVVGGLAGASTNFEPTYFWDAMTPEVIDWLHQNTEQDESVRFATEPLNWVYLHRWKTFRFTPALPGFPLKKERWYVLQHRTGALRPSDRMLIANFKPAFQKRLFGVPLISIYDINDFREAVRTSERVNHE